MFEVDWITAARERLQYLNIMARRKPQKPVGPQGHLATDTYEQSRIRTAALIPAALVDLIRTGVSPRRGQTSAIYIRVVKVSIGVLALALIAWWSIKGWVTATRVPH